MALFLEPATMASVWQLGASGPIKPAMSLKEDKDMLEDNKQE